MTVGSRVRTPDGRFGLLVQLRGRTAFVRMLDAAFQPNGEVLIFFASQVEAVE